MSRLPAFLLSTGRLSAAQFEQAQREAERRGERIAAALVDRGFLPARSLADALVELTLLPLVDPLPDSLPPHILRKIPPAIARELQAIPLDSSGGVLRIAMLDPADDVAAGILRDATGMRIEPVVAMRHAIADALDRFYPEDADVDVDVTRFIPASLREETAPTAGRAAGAVFEVGSDTLMRSFAEPLQLGAPEEPGCETLSLQRGSTIAAASSVFLKRLLELAEENARRLDRIEARLEELLSRKR